MFASRRATGGPFASRRSLAMGRRGMVCTSQGLASSAGLDVLRRGGNAIDAAIAAVAVLGVVEPYNTGVGGDCFLLAWMARERRLYGLNGSGRAPAAATIDELARRGHDAMPVSGMLSVTVPGAVDAWCEALVRLGTRSLAEVLAPAIAYAEDGFPVTEIVAHEWNLVVRFGILSHPEALRTFTVDGAAPRLGTIVRNPDLARTLRTLGRDGRDAFYRGELAERLVAFAHAEDGLLAADDLAAHRSTWVEPISTAYRDTEVFELPPNGQGLTALLALNILEALGTPVGEPGDPASIHRRIEAVKLAMADRNRWLADPDHAAVPTAGLLSKAYARERAALLDPRRALACPAPGTPAAGTDTVYLATADADGNVVSLINSLYRPFGSGMVVPGTGIALQNRGHGFVLERGHPNALAPRKRPLHTIIPAMLFADGAPRVAFGVMGGNVQAQAHVQVVSNLVDHGLNVQEALDAPRFHYLDGARVALEPSHPPETAAALAAMGHVIEGPLAALARGGFGGGQGIMIDPATGAYWGGSDARKDGCAIGF